MHDQRRFGEEPVVCVPRWRIAAAIAVLACMGVLAVSLIPVYYRSYLLGQYVKQTTESVENLTHSDDLLRTRVVEKAQSLDLPVQAGDVHIERSRAGMRIDAKYVVRVTLFLYSVDLHFHPAAGR